MESIIKNFMITNASYFRMNTNIQKPICGQKLTEDSFSCKDAVSFTGFTSLFSKRLYFSEDEARNLVMAKIERMAKSALGLAKRTKLTEFLSERDVNALKKESRVFSDFLESLNNPVYPISVVVGELPAEWAEKISGKDIKTVSGKIFDAFAYASKLLQANLSSPDKRVPHIAEDIISNAFTDAGIAKGQILLTKIGDGVHGTAYRFKVNGKNFVIKVFNIDVWARRSEWGHGQIQEINRAAFFKKNAKRTQFIPFHFGDPAHSYMIVDHADYLTKAPGQVLESDYGITNVDLHSGNSIGDFVIDHGGQILTDRGIGQNKTARWVNKQFKGVKDKEKVWDKLFNSAKVPNQEGLQLGLASALRLLPKEKVQSRFDKLCSMELTPFAKKTLMGLLDLIAPEQRLEYLEKLIGKPDDRSMEILKLLKNLKSIRTAYDVEISNDVHAPHIRTLVADDPKIVTILARTLACNIFDLPYPEALKAQKIIENINHKKIREIFVNNFEQCYVQKFRIARQKLDLSGVNAIQTEKRNADMAMKNMKYEYVEAMHKIDQIMKSA